MKTFTLSEFEALAARDDWSHEQSLTKHGEIHDKTEGTDIHGEFDLIDKTTIYGEATVTSTWRSQGPSATHEIECCHENLHAFNH